MGEVIPFRPKNTVKKAPHDWGPSRVGHGNYQCKRCQCTDLEAKHALGPMCETKD